MESIPRITRAQSMDALSSQATVAGYKAVLLAADRSPKMFPLLMTAAGTIAPARALILGAGVAGLQAIATARRLGAVVSAFDVRAAVKEQVESLGAAFLDLGVRAEETAGGYATELTPEQQAAQQRELEERIPEFDIVDHDGPDPGPRRAAPDPRRCGAEDATRLGDRRPRRRGGRELRADHARSETDEGGVTIVGLTNLPSLMAADASRLYARNISHCSSTLLPAASSHSTSTDEITAGACVAGAPRAAARPTRTTRRHRVSHHLSLVIELTILALAIFLGFEVISKVPTMLHTPLMSGTNFIHGIVIVGAIIVLGDGRRHVPEDRRLRRARARDRQRRRRLVRHRPHARDVQDAATSRAPRHGRRDQAVISDPNVIGLLYLVDDHLLHPRAALPLVAQARAPGELDRRRRDAPRDREHAPARRASATGC